MMKEKKMNVIKFRPLLKQTLWGGNKIVAFKHLDSQLDHVGESWEISGVEGNESIVSDGAYEGEKLNTLVSEFKEKFVGKDNYQRYGNEFPLLIKFIDAQQDLSIQVHPSDELARTLGEKRGKTEMWYIMESDSNASLCCGLNTAITPEEYKKMIADGSITNVINKYPVSEGDCFFIPAGRIHSIGAGCFLAEIQETSDVTYRIFDFNRRDSNGNLRQLHTDLAAQAIDYHVETNCRTDYTPMKNEGVEMVSCKHFTTSVYDLTEPMTLDYSELDSFVILICTKGEGNITDEEGNTYTFKAGETVLLPAWVNTVTIDGNIKLLETY